MNMFARFDENLAMTLQDIKKKNITEGRTDNLKTVYPPQTKFGGGGGGGVNSLMSCLRFYQKRK